MNEKIERLKAIKLEQEILSAEKAKIISELPNFEAYENGDGTWTRYTMIDRMNVLASEGKVLNIEYMDRYLSKVEILKNKPKELM